MEITDFVLHQHLSYFVEAAREFNCYILIRKTGSATLQWVGKRGFTGKRGDLKAKTANHNTAQHKLAGLVCSPFLLPEVFTPERLIDARKKWLESSHFITLPKNDMGFDDNGLTKGCRTPYVLQNNPKHRYYGCIALVDMGLLLPRYVHGDYDLYAIIPAGQRFDPNQLQTRPLSLGFASTAPQLTLAERLRQMVPNIEGQLSFRVATYINNCIERSSPDLLGALMINHGEQVNIGQAGQTFEPVLAVLPKPRQGQWVQILQTKAEHEQFYLSA